MLTSEEKRAAFRIFERSLAFEGSERDGFLHSACAESPSLTVEVNLLLAEDAASSVSTGSFSSVFAEPAADHLGTVLGKFRLLEHLGSGGMGIAFRGERIGDISQRAAVKLVRQELRSANSRARFNLECTTLARLEHPSIARLIDAGVTAEGRPWYAMEFVPGLPIDQYCAAKQLNIHERVALMIKLCAAVEAAHRLLIVHRDIKPSNVLVTDDGTPKLIDFGIAKFLASDAEGEGLTLASGALFTPHFASPEQVNGEPATTAVDVYGLGALAFLLLTDRKIFQGATRSNIDYLRVVMSSEPEVASRVSGVTALRGDLDNILLKALAREPANRYESPAAFAADLNNFLEHRPVRARPPTLRYRSAKFIRRNRLSVTLAVTLGAGSVVGLIAFYLQSREVALQRNEARIEAARTSSINNFLNHMLESADPRIGARETTVAQVLDNAVKTVGGSLPDDPAVAVSILQTVTNTNESLGRFSQALASNKMALDLYRKGALSPLDEAAAIGQRGNLLRESGKLQESEPLLRDSLARIEKLKPGGVEDAMARSRLAVVLSNTSRERAALPLFSQALAQLRAANVRDARMASVLNDYAVALGNIGELPKAVALHREAVAVAEAALGSAHPSVDDALMNLAGALESSREAPQAELILRRVVSNRTITLGAKHVDTAWAEISLANNLNLQKRYAEALPLAQQAHDALAESMGPDHPLALYASAEIAQSACNSGDFVRGLAAVSQTLAGRRRIYPAGHWLIANAEALLGFCQMAAGELAQAERTLMASTTVLIHERGETHENTQASIRYLVAVYTKLGRPREAESWRARLVPSVR